MLPTLELGKKYILKLRQENESNSHKNLVHLTFFLKENVFQ